MNNRDYCEAIETAGCGATYNFYNACKCKETGSGLKMDLLFDGTASETGIPYNLNAPITGYTALIEECGLFNKLENRWSVSTMMIPYPQIYNGDISYHHMLHITVGNPVRRWIVNWYLSSATTFTILALSVAEGADGSDSGSPVGIRKIYGIK